MRSGSDGTRDKSVDVDARTGSVRDVVLKAD
jgi:hypothetical protein